MNFPAGPREDHPMKASTYAVIATAARYADFATPLSHVSITRRRC
jgi:hypothetical protein